MKFSEFDINQHDLNNVADLIYETEPELFSLLFGSKKEKALSRIISVIKTGNNSFGHEFIYLAIEKNEILGLTIIYKGNEIDLQDLVIIEIKSDRNSENSPLKLALRDLRIKSAGFSKYCIGRTIIDNRLKRNRFKSKIRRLEKLIQPKTNLYSLNNQL